MRLFVGVPIAMDSVRAVSALVDQMRAAGGADAPRVRWVAPANYHVTLKFLGEARPEAVSAVRDAVAEALADEPAFSFTARGAGAFPSVERARVLWVGVDDPGDHLTRLASVCEAALEPLGFARERRPFHPHVTIGRLKQVANVEKLVLPCTEQRCSETFVQAVNLYESEIKAGGSEYRVRAEWPLRHTAPVEPTSGNIT